MDVLSRFESMDLFKRFKSDYSSVRLNDPKSSLYLDIKKEYEALVKLVESFQLYNSENGHYTTCPWSHPRTTDGPDTCVCSSVAIREWVIKTKLLELYSIDSLKNEVERLKTFVGWPSKVCPVRLALAGFYYTKESDIVKCAFCGLLLLDWRENDDPLIDHKKWSEDCPYLTLLEQERPKELSKEGKDVCGIYSMERNELRETNSGVEQNKNKKTAKEKRCKIM